MFSDTWKQPKSISTVWDLSFKLNWLHVKTLVVVLAGSHYSAICCTFVTAKGHFLVQSVRFRVSCGWVSLLFRRGTSDRLCHWYEIAMSVQIWGLDIYYNTTNSMYEMTIYKYTYIRLNIQWNIFFVLWFLHITMWQSMNIPYFFPPGTAALPRFSFWMWPQDVPRWWVATGSGWF
jgi:hypothetical protein